MGRSGKKTSTGIRAVLFNQSHDDAFVCAFNRFCDDADYNIPIFVNDGINRILERFLNGTRIRKI